MVLKILIKLWKRDFLTLKSCLVRVKIEISWYQYWYFMVYYYHAENFLKKNCKKGSQDMIKAVKIWSFDLLPPANWIFWDTDISVILKA